MADRADGFTPLPGIHVVIVDDNDDARELLMHVLQCCRAVVTCVRSAEDALVVLDRVRPDVLVSDLAMLRMDGYTFIRSVREMPAERGSAIPAIAITAFAEDYDSGKAYEAGFDAYLRKRSTSGHFASAWPRLPKTAAAQRPGGPMKHRLRRHRLSVVEVLKFPAWRQSGIHLDTPRV